MKGLSALFNRPLNSHAHVLTAITKSPSDAVNGAVSVVTKFPAAAMHVLSEMLAMDMAASTFKTLPQRPRKNVVSVFTHLSLLP